MIYDYLTKDTVLESIKELVENCGFELDGAIEFYPDSSEDFEKHKEKYLKLESETIRLINNNNIGIRFSKDRGIYYGCRIENRTIYMIFDIKTLFNVLKLELPSIKGATFIEAVKIYSMAIKLNLSKILKAFSADIIELVVIKSCLLQVYELRQHWKERKSDTAETMDRQFRDMIYGKDVFKESGRFKERAIKETINRAENKMQAVSGRKLTFKEEMQIRENGVDEWNKFWGQRQPFGRIVSELDILLREIDAMFENSVKNKITEVDAFISDKTD
jgi:hypothetical protein